MISTGALNDSSNDSSHHGDPHMVRVSSPRDHGDEDEDDDDEEEEEDDDEGDDYDLIVATNDDIYDNIEMPAALQGRTPFSDVLRDFFLRRELAEKILQGDTSKHHHSKNAQEVRR